MQQRRPESLVLEDLGFTPHLQLGLPAKTLHKKRSGLSLLLPREKLEKRTEHLSHHLLRKNLPEDGGNLGLIPQKRTTREKGGSLSLGLQKEIVPRKSKHLSHCPLGEMLAERTGGLDPEQKIPLQEKSQGPEAERERAIEMGRGETEIEKGEAEGGLGPDLVLGHHQDLEQRVRAHHLGEMTEMITLPGGKKDGPMMVGDVHEEVVGTGRVTPRNRVKIPGRKETTSIQMLLIQVVLTNIETTVQTG